MSATSYLATASYGTYVYQLDGTTPKSLKYSTTTDTWTVIKSIPTGRMGDSAGAVTVGTRIYVFGGRLLASDTNLRNEAYDTQTDTWATKAALPSRQTNGAVGVKGNTAFVAGGSPAVNTLQIYDAAADSWTSGIAALPMHVHSERDHVTTHRYLAVGREESSRRKGRPVGDDHRRLVVRSRRFDRATDSGEDSGGGQVCAQVLDRWRHVDHKCAALLPLSSPPLR